MTVKLLILYLDDYHVLLVASVLKNPRRTASSLNAKVLMTPVVSPDSGVATDWTKDPRSEPIS